MLLTYLFMFWKLFYPDICVPIFGPSLEPMELGSLLMEPFVLLELLLCGYPPLLIISKLFILFFFFNK
jgi:hypothetical protein